MDRDRLEAVPFRILVVDDERMILDLIADILAECGWQVEALDSPLEALKKIKRERYDALVLDIYMPELPGMLLHAKVKVTDRELARRTIFVTGHFSREELRKDLERSAMVVMKPFHPNELIKAVSTVLPQKPRAAAGARATSAVSGPRTPVLT